MSINKLFDLAGKRALVTGGNSGLGAAMALALGEKGADVVLAARRESGLQEVSSQLKTQGINAGYYVWDLSKLDQISDNAQKVVHEFGNIDIVINAAGVNLRESFSDITPSSWQLQLDLHLGAPFFLTQALAPAMKNNGWGRIINVGSLQSFRAFANSAPYGSAKGGIVQLTRAIAQEWSKYGINCNAIGPGYFRTPLTEAVLGDPEKAQACAMQTCAQRIGNTEDIHGLAVFLASDASAYITGQTIMIDGGFTSI